MTVMEWTTRQALTPISFSAPKGKVDARSTKAWGAPGFEILPHLSFDEPRTLRDLTQATGKSETSVRKVLRLEEDCGNVRCVVLVGGVHGYLLARI